MRMLEVTLPAETSAVSTARDSLDRLRSHLSDEQLEDARLMVSELVTNSLRHAKGEASTIDLRADLEGSRLKVQVRDGGAGFLPKPRRMSETPADSGWGLYLVEQLSDRWGATVDGTNTVWFELRVDRGDG
jgi:anti-sigma regulatory factor (Ser/Thr protein kinase)